MRKYGIIALAAASLMTLSACATEEKMVSTEIDPGFDMLAAQNYTGAEAYFAELVGRDAENPWAHLNLGVAHEGQGEFAEAATHYQHAVSMGDGVPVGKTVYNGQVKIEDTTVAALGAYNLANLPQ